MNIPDDAGFLDRVFRTARTPRAWTDRPLDPALLKQIYDLAKLAPTSANCSPLRIVFCASDEARRRLADCASSGNRARVLSAPATAIFANDLAFYENLPELFPHTDARSWFAGKPDHIATTAFRNATLQAAYFMLAARALGLDVGPMSGFDAPAVEAAFLADTGYRANFICGLGYADRSGLRDRHPRLAFDRVCRVL